MLVNYLDPYMTSTIRLICLLPLTLSACALPYMSQQGADRQKCLRNPNTEEMRECMNRKPVSYDEYMKQREILTPGAATPPIQPTQSFKPSAPAAASPANTAAPAPATQSGPICFTNATTGTRVCTD